MKLVGIGVMIRTHPAEGDEDVVVMNQCWKKRILSQGQTSPNVGIYLPRHDFTHGQLYVALSRGVSQNSTNVLVKEGKIEGEDGDFMKKCSF
ncbi:hypothetical protein MTR_6g054870 [Medicago truncatula]|uniref:Uncharacterized protein n=1 Tax=Medicago truncatula TaxID=3880 RepID=G7KLJ6_MEDTR|nr:hypothetical protein MTR_6g054870 [Medicago truncatula]